MPDLPPLKVAFLLFPKVTQLDLTGPAQVLSRLGNTKVDLVAKTRDPVPTDAGSRYFPPPASPTPRSPTSSASPAATA